MQSAEGVGRAGGQLPCGQLRDRRSISGAPRVFGGFVPTALCPAQMSSASGTWACPEGCHLPGLGFGVRLKAGGRFWIFLWLQESEELGPGGLARNSQMGLLWDQHQHCFPGSSYRPGMLTKYPWLSLSVGSRPINSTKHRPKIFVGAGVKKA